MYTLIILIHICRLIVPIHNLHIRVLRQLVRSYLVAPLFLCNDGYSQLAALSIKWPSSLNSRNIERCFWELEGDFLLRAWATNLRVFLCLNNFWKGHKSAEYFRNIPILCINLDSLWKTIEKKLKKLKIIFIPKCQ